MTEVTEGHPNSRCRDRLNLTWSPKKSPGATFDREGIVHQTSLLEVSAKFDKAQEKTMKPSTSTASLAATLLSLIVLASVAFAANPAIELPRGLAVDAKGNLYVANSAGNNILVYSPGYILQPSKTITQGISTPWGVAFDTLGDLFVANNGTNTITMYTGGKQNTNATITDGIVSPRAIAVDGQNTVWVENNYSNITVYGVSLGSALLQLKTMAPANPPTGLAVAAGMMVVGSDYGVSFIPSAPALLGLMLTDDFGSSTGCALASDVKGNVYIGNLDGSVQISVAQLGNPGPPISFVQLPFVPSGVAVDNVRGRVYFSNYNDNSISVYSTAGTLLHVIQ